MKKYLSVFVILSFVLLAGCKKNNPPQYMAFDEVAFIEKFPVTIPLKNKSSVEIDIIGIEDFHIQDSLWVLYTPRKQGLLTLVSLPGLEEMGSFLIKGNGPNEFVQPPVVAKTSFYREEGDLKAAMYDFQKGRVLVMNLCESVRTGLQTIESITDSLPKMAFDFIPLPDNRYFVRETNARYTRQDRYILENREKTVTDNMEKLNEVILRPDEDLNILSTIIKASPDQKMIVEIPISLNQINLYALDGSFAKTLCVGEQLDDIEKIQDMDRWDRKYTYADLRVYPDFWGVVYINELDGNWMSETRGKLPTIQFFDWQGEPLAELTLDHHITAFDIDFVNGDLYTMDHRTEEIFKYDVSELLAEVF